MQDRARLRARVGHYALTTAATAAAVTLLLIAGTRAQGAPQSPAGTAATAPQTATPAPQGRGGAGGVYPEYVPDDDEGFVPIFDGKTLTGWDGDTTFWRAENGEIIGESTPEKVVKANSFLIWRAGTVKDFELKTEFRISGTNSGIQYRSVELPDVGKWVLKGYQADIDFVGEYLGNVHEERGRKPGHVVLAKRGMLTRISAGPKYKTLATIADGTLLQGGRQYQRLEQISHHRARSGDDADHQRPAHRRDDRRGHQELRARRAARLPDARRAVVQSRIPEYPVQEAGTVTAVPAGSAPWRR